MNFIHTDVSPFYWEINIDSQTWKQWRIWVE